MLSSLQQVAYPVVHTQYVPSPSSYGRHVLNNSCPQKDSYHPIFMLMGVSPGHEGFFVHWDLIIGIFLSLTIPKRYITASLSRDHAGSNGMLRHANLTEQRTFIRINESSQDFSTFTSLWLFIIIIQRA